MEDNTNSTRLELTKLKNELNITTKGLGLLKNKLEELIKVFFSIFNIYKNDNSAVTDYFKEIFDSFSKGLINTYTTSALNTSLCSKSYVTIKSENINIMNVIIPAVDTKIFKDNTYTIDKDFSINKSKDLLADNFDKIISLAVLEKQLVILTKEIEKLRRRTTSIEHIVIPSLNSKIKYIASKLDDLERENSVRVMKAKELLSR